jgi:hypothetical protein
MAVRNYDDAEEFPCVLCDRYSNMEKNHICRDCDERIDFLVENEVRKYNKNDDQCHECGGGADLDDITHMYDNEKKTYSESICTWCVKKYYPEKVKCYVCDVFQDKKYVVCPLYEDEYVCGRCCLTLRYGKKRWDNVVIETEMEKTLTNSINVARDYVDSKNAIIARKLCGDLISYYSDQIIPQELGEIVFEYIGAERVAQFVAKYLFHVAAENL